MTKFSKETKKSKDRRKRERKAEAAEAEDYAKELGLTDDQSSLERAIMQRQVKIIIIFVRVHQHKRHSEGTFLFIHRSRVIGF
jgi:hypothetical protein